MRAIRRRRAQSAVEIMLLTPIVMMVFMAMYYLWSITFAAQNCHMRAREYALHGDTYLQGRSHGTTGSTVFAGSDYQKARRWPANFSFRGTSTDQSIPGTGVRGQNLTTTAVITSN